MRQVAAAAGIAFVDCFKPTRPAMREATVRLSDNGVHLNEAGYRLFAREVFQSVFQESPPDVNETLRGVVVDMNRNGSAVTGRSTPSTTPATATRTTATSTSCPRCGTSR